MPNSYMDRARTQATLDALSEQLFNAHTIRDNVYDETADYHDSIANHTKTCEKILDTLDALAEQTRINLEDFAV